MPAMTAPLGPAAWAALVAGIGLVATGERPLVDVAVVVGLVVVAPLALGGSGPWALAGVAAAVALSAGDAAVATLAAIPAVVVAGWSTIDRLRGAGVHDLRSARSALRSPAVISSVVVPAWAVVGSASIVASVAGLELFGIGEPIVRLTAVHYLYAGVGALEVARRVMLERPPGARLPIAAVLTTAAAPPIVAAGFVLGHPVPQVGGALLMTVGVWLTAACLLASARRTPDPRARALRVLAGLTPWVPMILAVAWATAQHVGGFPALSVPEMARTHGLANGLGFVVLGLLGTTPVPAGSRELVDAEAVT